MKIYKLPKNLKNRPFTYQEALEKELAVMDLAAFCQCRDHGMELRVFNINKPGALLKVILGEEEGTTVNNDLAHQREQELLNGEKETE